jgi:hypothetical protein
MGGGDAGVVVVPEDEMKGMVAEVFLAVVV